jgi:hypothetical protein
MIPDGIDILITHGPPKGTKELFVDDSVGHGGKTYDGTDAGCDDLLNEIRTRVKPKVTSEC